MYSRKEFVQPNALKYNLAVKKEGKKSCHLSSSVRLEQTRRFSPRIMQTDNMEAKQPNDLFKVSSQATDKAKKCRFMLHSE